MNEDLTRTAFMREKEARYLAEDRADRHLMEADTDALTGLLNLRGLERRTCGREWGWFVVADLDGFKTEQDKPDRGHPWGNRILVEFAEFLFSNTRQGEMRTRDILAARTGGDEFTLWCETRAGARRIKEMLREWRSEIGNVTASAGMGSDRAPADGAMYLDKEKRGGGR